MVWNAVSVHVKEKLDKRPVRLFICQSSGVWMGVEEEEEERESWCFHTRPRPGAANWQLYPAHDGRNVRRTKEEMGGGCIGEGREGVQVEEGSKHYIFFSSAFLFTASLSPNFHTLFLPCLLCAFLLSIDVCPFHLYTPSSLRPSQLVTFNQRTSCGLTFPIQYKHTGYIP